jgi:hypothetical protein
VDTRFHIYLHAAFVPRLWRQWGRRLTTKRELVFIKKEAVLISWSAVALAPLGKCHVDGSSRTQLSLPKRQ